MPNCRAYDPAFAYEVAVIVDHGARRMLERGRRRVLLPHREERELRRSPRCPTARAKASSRGLYRVAARPSGARVRLLGSGAILREAMRGGRAARRRLGRRGGGLLSATSFTELARDAREIERWNRLHPHRGRRRQPRWRRRLPGDAPVVAATDYVRAYPQLIAGLLDAPFVALGTDGFGRSDTRAALRRFFEVDRHAIAVAALWALAREGRVDSAVAAAAVARYGLDGEAAPPWMM